MLENILTSENILGKINEFFQIHCPDFPLEIKNNILHFANKEIYDQLKRGYYNSSSPGQPEMNKLIMNRETFFNKLFFLLGLNKYIFASSANEMTTGKFATSNIIGETVAKGLVGKHAYEVVACHVRQSGQRVESTKFVLLKNPWGSYVRHYCLDEQKTRIKTTENTQLSYQQIYRDYNQLFGPVAKTSLPGINPYCEMHESGLFELEWNDFLKRFTTVYVIQG